MHPLRGDHCPWLFPTTGTAKPGWRRVANHGCVSLCQRAIDENPPPSVRTWDELPDDALLAEMVRIHASHRQVDDAVAQVVGRLRARRVTWTRIGEALGMTRQSAWERFSGAD